MLAAWEEYARGAADAAVRRFPGVTAGVFPCGPERAFYNNALLERDLGAAERADAVEAMEAAYTAGGVTQFAAWVHESDAPMRGDLEQRGYTLQETTRAMGMALDDIRLPRPEIELAPADWGEYLRASGFAAGPPRGRRSGQGFTSSSRLSRARTSPSRWRSISAQIAGSTTSAPWSTPGGAAWARPLRPSPSTMRATADARRRASSRPRWPRAYTPPSASGIWAGSSSTGHRARPAPATTFRAPRYVDPPMPVQ